MIIKGIIFNFGRYILDEFFELSLYIYLIFSINRVGFLGKELKD